VSEAEGPRGLEAGRRAALVISECQRGVLDPARTSIGGLAEQAAARGILPKIARLADAFRAAREPVFHIHLGFRADWAGVAVSCPMMGRSRRHGALVAGAPDAEAMPEVAPREEDFVCARRSGLAMWYGTDVDAMLRHCRIETLVMVGVSTNLALFGGCLGAVDRGYSVVLPEDATAGATAETHAWMIEHTLPMLATLTTVDAVVGALGGRSGGR